MKVSKPTWITLCSLNILIDKIQSLITIEVMSVFLEYICPGFGTIIACAMFSGMLKYPGSYLGSINTPYRTCLYNIVNYSNLFTN